MNVTGSGYDNGAGEPDTDQLTQEDTLIDRGIVDALDEGYSPPENAPRDRVGETALEEVSGESIEQRTAQEQPEVWSEDFHPALDATRSGRLVQAIVPEFDADGVAQDRYAEDVGFDGGAASAEEAAVHIVEEDKLGYFDEELDELPEA